MQPNNYSRFKSIGQLAEKNSPLSKLLDRASKIINHQETVRAALEPSCREHCWLSNYRNGTLYLQTDSSAWGSRLRMQQRAIIQQLKKTTTFAALQNIKVSIQPRYTTQTAPRTVKPISSENAQQLFETAEETEDPALKAALMRLAQTSQNRKNG